jgi:hypothetical protein
MIKRKYRYDETIQSGVWFARKDSYGKLELLFSHGLLHLNVFAHNRFRPEFFEVDQCAAEVAMTPLPEPKYGEWWLCKDDSNNEHVYLYSSEGWLDNKGICQKVDPLFRMEKVNND